METIIDFPGGAKADAYFDSYTIPTDQPPQFEIVTKEVQAS